MWRRPTGPAGSGPHRSPQDNDYDPHALEGTRVVSGRVLTQEFLDAMVAAREHQPPPVNFVQQMRDRKKTDGTP